ncbi:MAG: hypothetical protein RIQ89_1263 [Bacteroidota bacterium]|jgi:hypothetical protein
MQNTFQVILIGIFISIGTACRVNYSFTGGSVSPEVKTVCVKYFTKTIALGPPNLGQKFSEALRDKFLLQTKLQQVASNGDFNFEGSITNYSTQPLSIQSNEAAAQNRLTISVNVKFTNVKDEKQNFETSFSRFADFPASKNLTQVEQALITEINTQLVDDIFNKSVVNW